MKRRDKTADTWESQRKKLIGLGERSFQKSYFPALQNELEEHRRTELELRRANRALRTITECNQAIVRATSVASFIEKACKIIEEVNEYPFVWIGIIPIDTISEKTDFQLNPIVHSEKYAKSADVKALIELEVKGNKSPAATAVRRKKPFILRRLSGKTPSPDDWRTLAQKAGFRSMIVLPLMINQRVLGVLSIHVFETQIFDTLEIRQLAELAEDLANGIEALHERILRQQAEMALSISETRFRMLVEQSPFGFIILSPDGRFEYANRATQEMFGVSPEIYKRLAENYNIHDDPFFARYNLLPFLEQAFSGATVQVPAVQISPKSEDIFWYTHSNPKWVETFIYPITDSKNNLHEIVIIHNDVTERIEAEGKFLESEGRYRSFVQNFQGIAYRLGADTSSSFFHGAVETITGYTEEEFLLNNPPWDAIVHPDDQVFFKNSASLTMARLNSLFEREYRIIRKDKQVRWVHEVVQKVRDNSDRPPDTQGAIYDITERKHSENELYQRNLELSTIATILSAAATQLNLQTILDHALIGTLGYTGLETGFICLIDQEANTISLNAYKNVSQEFVDKLSEQNFQLSQVIFDSVLDKAKPLTIEIQKLVDHHQEINSAQESLDALTIFPVLARNQLTGILCLLSPIGSEPSAHSQQIILNICGTLGLAIQNARLYEQVQQHAADLEQRVLERTAELEAANKELETFAYSVSHDLKAPLRGIDGYSRLLLEEYEDKLGEEGKLFLLSIRRATILMHQLISDLLEYSRLERRQHVTRQINPASFVEALINEFEAFNTQKIDMVFDVDPKPIFVEPEGLAQALRNLIENAIKFSGDVPDPRVEIVGRKKENSFLIWVRDNGIGFDMRYHDRIFNIFQRLHNYDEYPGTGIGLALARKAIQRMEGKIWAESSPGAGSTFFIEIPQ